MHHGRQPHKSGHGNFGPKTAAGMDRPAEPRTGRGGSSARRGTAHRQSQQPPWMMDFTDSALAIGRYATEYLLQSMGKALLHARQETGCQTRNNRRMNAASLTRRRRRCLIANDRSSELHPRSISDRFACAVKLHHSINLSGSHEIPATTSCITHIGDQQRFSFFRHRARWQTGLTNSRDVIYCI